MRDSGASLSREPIVHIVLILQALAVAAAALLAPACSEAPNEPSGPLDKLVTLGRGQSARIDEARLTLRFDTVSGDSRCPADALCITGGDAIVKVSVLPYEGRAAQYDLHTATPASATHDSVTLTLEELSPYPFSSRPFDPSEYRASIRLTR
jgi:hypothetical protein